MGCLTSRWSQPGIAFRLLLIVFFPVAQLGVRRERRLSWRTDFLTADHAEYADFFSCISRGSRLQFGESWPEIFEEMNTSPNQPLEATGVSARDWPWSFRFAPSVLAGASADR